MNYLQPLQRDDVKSVIGLHLIKYPSRPVTAEDIASATGFSVESIQAAINSKMRTGKLLYLEGRGYLDKSLYELLKSRLVEVAKDILSKDAFKLGISSDEIRFRCDGES